VSLFNYADDEIASELNADWVAVQQREKIYFARLKTGLFSGPFFGKIKIFNTKSFKMIKIEFNQEEIELLSSERYHYPHPLVQRRIEALFLKSKVRNIYFKRLIFGLF
jgi:hypothetical protein